MIKTGIVGLGKMGMSHYAILNAHPDVDLVAACDSSWLILSAVERFSSVKTFKDYKEMIDKCQLDCILIATPTSSHAQIIRYAMERDIHVFVEKPFCLTSEEGHKMIDLANKCGLVNQVGYHNRFIGAFQKARELICNDVVGDIYNFRAEAHGQVVIRPKMSTWRMKSSEGGGCLYDYASHVIDLVNYLVGPPEEVYGTVLRKIFSEDVTDAVYSTFLYKGNKSGHLSVNWSDKSFRKMSTQITMYGTKGKIIADRQLCKVYLWEDEKYEKLNDGWNTFYTTELTKPVWFYLRGEEYSAQIDYFVKCVQNKTMENVNSFASAHQTDVIIDLIVDDFQKRN